MRNRLRDSTPSMLGALACASSRSIHPALHDAIHAPLKVRRDKSSVAEFSMKAEET